MHVLHDTTGADLTNVTATGDLSEGFALFDYVAIEQPDGTHWIGQIVQPNRNVSTVGQPLDPTVLHGLRLLQDHAEVQSAASTPVFEILLLGQDDGRALLTSRVRPRPGSAVRRLSAEATARVLSLAPLAFRSDGSANVIGVLLNVPGVPLTITAIQLMHHVLIVGGTGSGKSNAAANVVHQARLNGSCVIVHDAKPDYRRVGRPNTDRQVAPLWGEFAGYNFAPDGAPDIVRVGFAGQCDPAAVDVVVGFRASDFDPDLLAGIFFTGSAPAEVNAFEGLAGAAHAKAERRRQGDIQAYSLDDILVEVRRRGDPAHPPADSQECIHEMTARNILRKVAVRRRGLPWLDAVGQPVADLKSGGGPAPTRLRLASPRLDGSGGLVVGLDLPELVRAGRVLVVDYDQLDDASYALILSTFLRDAHVFRKRRRGPGILQLVDEAHRVFDNASRHTATLELWFNRAMREGRSIDHAIVLSLQNASQVPPLVMNNLNSKIVLRQNSKAEAEAATQAMGKAFAAQALALGTGHALVSLFGSRAIVLAQMAPSPYELLRVDNTGGASATEIEHVGVAPVPTGQAAGEDLDDLPF